ncbi:hypothetical protein ABFA25_11545 [Mycobacterium lepromatosis]|nr:hypothetical protein [Mycobacterium lepromatosis]UKN42422.1 lipoprotein [Mycobacterium lepromatosis]
MTGCSSNPLDSSPPTIEPAQPAGSPPVSQKPVGAVRPLGGHPQGAVFDSGIRRLAVLCPGTDPTAPANITVFDDTHTRPRVIVLPGPATALTSDDHGTAYLATHGGYFVVDLVGGHTSQVNVTVAGRAKFTAIARRADAKLVLGSDDGAVYTLAATAPGTDTATASNRKKIFARIDSLVTQGNNTVVLDGKQTSVTTIGADGHVQQALRAGEGATTLAADPLGRILVADTRSGQLLVYSVDPLILRQTYPVRHAPYGLAGSRKLAWVSQTASNIVIGYDLNTGIPVEKVRYPTVQQPNSLAFDEASDTLYVVSESGAGVQIIEHAAGTH